MEKPDREHVRNLFRQCRKQRDGIRNIPELATICLICESTAIIPKKDHAQMLVCRNCDFPFYRYTCTACGATIDGRDPQNPGCHACGLRVCTCGACGCPTGDTP